MIPEASGSDLKAESNPFYQLRDFRLIKRNPIEVPSYLALSANYFNPKWTGERRLKNVVCVLEYMPNAEEVINTAPPTLEDMAASSDLKHQAQVQVVSPSSPHSGGDVPKVPQLVRTLSSKTASRLEQAFALFDVFKENRISPLLVKHLVFTAMDQFVSDETADRIYRAFAESKEGERVFTPGSLRKLLLSDAMRPIQKGRHFIALSLAEAETIRRIMHLKGPALRKLGVEFKLRIQPLDFAVLDRVMVGASLLSQLPDAKTDTYYHSEIANECFRFFDGELIYSDKAVNMLLRALQASAQRKRQLWFEHVLGCRRRMRKKWQETPLNKIFTLRNELHLLQQRAQMIRTRLAIQRRHISFFDAFKLFDTDKKGLLGPGELWAGLEWLEVPLDENDIIGLMRAWDLDGDRNLSWQDFAGMVSYADEDLQQIDRVCTRSRYIYIANF